MGASEPGPVPQDDVNGMLWLVGQIAELPPDPTLRRRCMLAGLCKLLDAAMGLAYCCRFESAEQHLCLASAADAGLSSRLQPLWHRYLKTGLPPDPKRQALISRTESISTWRRSELVDDRSYYQSAHFTQIRQPMGVDDLICSARRLENCAASFCVVEICRAPGQPRFTEAEKCMVHSVRTAGCRLHTVCGTATGVSPVQQLPPRLQSVLPLLLAGDSEKEIAAKLRLSQHTVHQYTKILYKRLCVRSRAELASKWSAAHSLAASAPHFCGNGQPCPTSVPV